MVKNVQSVGVSKPVSGATDVKKGQTAQKSANVDMKPKSDQYIETESYLKSRQEICAKDKELKEVMKKVGYTIAQDGSVRFSFKGDVNIEQFKKAFGFNDGTFRDYLRNRHEQGLKNGSVHANYTNGNQTNAEQRTDYEMGGLGSKITYTDGYSETKGYRGGWINRSKIVDKPDYTNMSLGPDDNEKLYTFGKSYFNYKN